MARDSFRISRLLTVLGLSAALVLALGVGEAQAEAGAVAKPGRFGLGLAGSYPASGITGKIYLSENQAVQATAGFWLFGGIQVSADYLFEFPTFVSDDYITLHWYLGVGGNAAFLWGGIGGGFQGVAGLDLQVREIPLEFVVEFRPTVMFNAGWPFQPGGAIAARYYF